MRSLQLVNFQKHRKRKLYFEPGINTITGKTDTGKSAIVRALRWLALNKPQGDSFKRHGRSRVTVSLNANGKYFKREKGKSNVYYLGSQEFKSFKTKVPDEIASALKLGELNFQRQFDAPHWFTLSPSDLAKKLNEIVNLEKIDAVIKKVSAGVREHSSTVKIRREDLKEARQQKKALAWVPDARKQLKQLLLTRELISEAEKIQDEMQTALNRLVQAEQDASLTIPNKEPVDEIVEILKKEEFNLDAMHRSMDRIAVQERTVHVLQAITKDAKQAFAKLTENSYCPICHQKIKNHKLSQ